MSDKSPPAFGPEDVIQISRAFAPDDESFVVGGQATNLWAWFYQDRDTELKLAGPFTSQDIDYFGTQSVAANVAKALGGSISLPKPDDATPNTALVTATVNGKKLEIDFLKSLLGIKDRDLLWGVSVLSVKGSIDGTAGEIQISVLHPVLCLKSRIVNMMHPATKRRDAIAKKQLAASKAIARLHIEDAIATDDLREANACFRTLYVYLRADRYVKSAHSELQFDALDILKHFRNDPRLDERYRKHQMTKFIETIELRRARASDKKKPA